MAHHLVDRHGAPARVILRRKPRHSTRYVLPFAEILQGLHKAASQSTELRTACGKLVYLKGTAFRPYVNAFQKIRL